MNTQTLLSVILPLLGGLNILSIFGYFTERKKRIHQAKITEHEADIKDADALNSMRNQYNLFVEDMIKEREMQKKLFAVQQEIWEKEMSLLKKSKDTLKSDYNELKKSTTALGKKLDIINSKCTNNCSAHA